MNDRPGGFWHAVESLLGGLFLAWLAVWAVDTLMMLGTGPAKPKTPLDEAAEGIAGAVSAIILATGFAASVLFVGTALVLGLLGYLDNTTQLPPGVYIIEGH